MECKVKNVIRITQGSKENVLIKLSDPETSDRLDLAAYESAKACFLTSSGAKIEKTISWPTTTPALGVIEFSLDSADTAQFDSDMSSFELELVYTGAANSEIIILKDSLEVTERIC